MTAINLYHLETAKLCQNSVKLGRVCIPGMTKGRKSTAQGGPCGWGTTSDSRTSRAGRPQTDRGNVCLVLAVPPLCPPVALVPQRISGARTRRSQCLGTCLCCRKCWDGKLELLRELLSTGEYIAVKGRLHFSPDLCQAQLLLLWTTFAGSLCLLC